MAAVVPGHEALAVPAAAVAVSGGAVLLSICAASIVGAHRADRLARPQPQPERTPMASTAPVVAHVNVTTSTSSNTPPIVTKLVALLIAIAGPLLAFVDPSGKLSTGSVQAAVALGGILIGAVIFIVHLVLENGLSKAGLEKTLSAEEQWVKDNYANLKSTFEAAKPALDALPFAPNVLTAVQTDLTAVHSRLDALPASDLLAVKAAVKDLVIPGVLKEANEPPAAPAAVASTTATITPPNVVVTTPAA